MAGLLEFTFQDIAVGLLDCCRRRDLANSIDFVSSFHGNDKNITRGYLFELVLPLRPVGDALKHLLSISDLIRPDGLKDFDEYHR